MKNESDISVYQPADLDELDTLVSGTELKLNYLAGTTDFMAQEARWEEADTLVNLSRIGEISQTIADRNDGLLIGAAVPMSTIIHHSVIQESFPILAEACRQIGSVQIQNRATLGGNIANASPAGDTLPVLNVLDAELWIGPRMKGEFEKFRLDLVMLGPGVTSLKGNRYIAYIFLPYPKTEGQRWYFRKVGQRHSMAISKLSLAVITAIRDGNIEDIRISAGSVSPQVKRAALTESILKGRHLSTELIEKAREAIMKEVSPITDIRSNSGYRKHMCGELLREALYRLM